MTGKYEKSKMDPIQALIDKGVVNYSHDFDGNGWGGTYTDIWKFPKKFAKLGASMMPESSKSSSGGGKTMKHVYDADGNLVIIHKAQVASEG